MRRCLRRLGRASARRPPAERLDLLFGTRAIARYMGLSRRQTRSIIASRGIPWFVLTGVVCARRSSIERHLRALELRSERVP